MTRRPHTATLAVEVSSLAALPAVGDDVWKRWLAPSELAYSRGFRRVDEHLGARWAAKRAVARILGWDGEPPWADLEIVRESSAAPAVRMDGALEDWRSSQRLPVPGVSLTHAGGHVAALAWLPGRR